MVFTETPRPVQLTGSWTTETAVLPLFYTDCHNLTSSVKQLLMWITSLSDESACSRSSYAAQTMTLPPPSFTDICALYSLDPFMFLAHLCPPTSADEEFGLYISVWMCVWVETFTLLCWQHWYCTTGTTVMVGLFLFQNITKSCTGFTYYYLFSDLKQPLFSRRFIPFIPVECSLHRWTSE